MAGFYSYGEIAPVNGGASCELHNQTMTLTLMNNESVTKRQIDKKLKGGLNDLDLS
jgi:hypothetical protein